jgi:hypothetical protein
MILKKQFAKKFQERKDTAKTDKMKNGPDV